MLVDIIKVQLSTQRGLLWNVFPELRAVCVDSQENLVSIYFYIDGEITDEQTECCESVLDDVISDVFVGSDEEENAMEFENPVICLDYPEKPPLIGHWVYYRDESLCS